MKGTIELLARGVLVDKGYLLLTHRKGATNTFLPGGHIMVGEPAETTLIRELQEETGRSVEVKKFLGAIEHSWNDEEGLHCELNLIFALRGKGLSSTRAPESREGHLEFLWQPLKDLTSVNLQPYPLCQLLPPWLKEEVRSGWASTLRKVTSPDTN